MRHLLYLSKMMEECGEVIQAASKVMIHGGDNYHPVTEVNNLDHLKEEIEDVMATFSIITATYGLDAESMTEALPAKVQKIETVVDEAIKVEIEKQQKEASMPSETS